MKNKYLALFFLFVLVQTVPVFADQNKSTTLFDSKALTKEVQKGKALWHVPGIAVAVVDKKQVLYQRGFGRTRIKNGQAVNQHTLFAIASTTKAMINSALLMLVDEGKLNLSRPVIEYLPEIHFYNGYLDQNITVSDLMSHSTGLPSTDSWTFFEKLPLKDQISRLKYVKPQASIRTRLIYQNTMYELLGMVIERVSGQSWHRFLKKRLWAPIGMSETYASRGDIPSRRRPVYPYYFRDNKLIQAKWNFNKDYKDAAGSVWSSIHDMSLWAQFLLNDAVTSQGKRLISEKSFALMFRPHQLSSAADFYPTVALTKPHWMSYGYGWFQQDFQGRAIDFHTGSLSGLIAIIGMDRKAGKAFIALANRDHAEMRHALMWWTLDNHNNADKRDWNQEIFDLYQGNHKKRQQRMEQLKNSRKKGTHPDLTLKQYTGLFHHDAWGDIQVSLDKNHLNITLGQQKFSLEHWQYNSFKYDDIENDYFGILTFNLNLMGQISNLDFSGEKFEKIQKIGSQ